MTELHTIEVETHTDLLTFYLPGVTGQNIPPAGVYPGILWPRPIYTLVYVLA